MTTPTNKGLTDNLLPLWTGCELSELETLELLEEVQGKTPALESLSSISATDGQIDFWRAVLLCQLSAATVKLYKLYIEGCDAVHFT